MSKPPRKGQRVRVDESAESALPDVPAFLAPPKNTTVYHGFPLLEGSEKEGFKFGAITEPNGAKPATWGDAFVVAPDGSRAGIVWQATGDPPPVVCEPGPGRWGSTHSVSLSQSATSKTSFAISTQYCHN